MFSFPASIRCASLNTTENIKNRTTKNFKMVFSIFQMGGNSSKNKKLSKEDVDFLLNNTNFTKRQIKQWYKGFMVSTILCVVMLQIHAQSGKIATNFEP